LALIVTKSLLAIGKLPLTVIPHSVAIFFISNAIYNARFFVSCLPR
jgi:hypothetical protein